MTVYILLGIATVAATFLFGVSRALVLENNVLRENYEDAKTEIRYLKREANLRSSGHHNNKKVTMPTWWESRN